LKRDSSTARPDARLEARGRKSRVASVGMTVGK
jgi:hypothetical protein